MLTSSPKGSDENQRETERLNVDTTLTSGVGSRWNLVQHIIRNPMEFNTSSPPPPARGRVVYASPPLEKDLVIVGAPRLRLSLRLISGTDTVVYAYLLDLAPERAAEEPSGVTSKNSDITGHQQPQGVYLTEGLLRAASRHSAAPDCQPTLSLGTLPLHSNFDRTFEREHRAPPVSAEEVITMDIHLEPVAARIEKGHSIQVALCGSDVDNFDHSQLQDLATAWEISYSHASKSNQCCALALPVRNTTPVRKTSPAIYTTL
jgi:predicted acyl esterase